ncbi:MAG: metal-dependent transcriptional regulator [Microthrixaceae bacterium]
MPAGGSPRSGPGTPARSGEYHPAFEEYCEAIYELAEDSVQVIQARIADRLEISRPAVSEMIRRMSAVGLVEVSDRIRLTDDGMALAESVVRRHRLAERMLTDILGLSWASAHVEAGKWEHVISPEVEAAITRLLGDPTTCPHGNPIPGSSYDAPETLTLASLGDGESFTVRRIPEELEFTEGMLEFLEAHDLRPDTAGVVTATATDGGRTVEVGGDEVRLDAFISERILVTSR